MRTWSSLIAVLLARAVASPRIALDLLTMCWVMRRRDWYRRTPFLPLPPKEYVAWRMYTAYGDPDFVPPPEDVIRFARWRREILRT